MILDALQAWLEAEWHALLARVVLRAAISFCAWLLNRRRDFRRSAVPVCKAGPVRRPRHVRSCR